MQQQGDIKLPAKATCHAPCTAVAARNHVLAARLQMADLERAEALLEELRAASLEAARKDLKEAQEYAAAHVSGGRRVKWWRGGEGRGLRRRPWAAAPGRLQPDACKLRRPACMCACEG